MAIRTLLGSLAIVTTIAIASMASSVGAAPATSGLTALKTQSLVQTAATTCRRVCRTDYYGERVCRRVCTETY